MSIKSWKSEFYPVSAKTAAKKSWVEACEHALLKWEGARPENLKKHDLTREWFADWADWESCALCRKTGATDAVEVDCSVCPVFLSRGARCFDPIWGTVSPYEARYETPVPMLRVLRKALAYAKRQEKRHAQG